MKTTSAARNTRLVPNRPPSQPDAGMSTARLTRNAVTTPSTRSSGTDRSREMVGSATFTTLTAILGLIRRAGMVFSERIRPRAGRRS